MVHFKSASLKPSGRAQYFAAPPLPIYGLLLLQNDGDFLEEKGWHDSMVSLTCSAGDTIACVNVWPMGDQHINAMRPAELRCEHELGHMRVLGEGRGAGGQHIVRAKDTAKDEKKTRNWAADSLPVQLEKMLRHHQAFRSTKKKCTF